MVAYYHDFSYDEKGKCRVLHLLIKKIMFNFIVNVLNNIPSSKSTKCNR